MRLLAMQYADIVHGQHVKTNGLHMTEKCRVGNVINGYYWQSNTTVCFCVLQVTYTYSFDIVVSLLLLISMSVKFATNML